MKHRQISNSTTPHQVDRGRIAGPDVKTFAALRRGVTLLELVLTIGAASVLVLGLGSALRMATLSIRPDATAATASAVSAGIVRLQDDLRFARRILSHSNTSVRMLTTDSDADGSEDLVEYSWSGLAGDPLLRRVNGGVAESVVESAHEFHLTWLRTPVPVSTPQPAEAGAEVLLDARDAAVSPNFHRITANASVGQHFDPATFNAVTFAASDTQWLVTRIEILQSRSAFPLWSTRLQLHSSDVDGLPTDTSFGAFTVPSLTASGSPSWKSYAFNMSEWLDQNQHVSLTAALATGIAGLDVWYEEGGGRNMLSTSQSSADWHRPSLRNGLLYRLYGRLRTPRHSEASTNLMTLDTVEIRLRPAQDNSRQFVGGCELLYQPLDERLHLETTVDTDPVLTDSDFSGTTDWTSLDYGTGSANRRFGPDYWTLKDVGLQTSDSLPAGLPVDLRITARDQTPVDRPLVVRVACDQSGGGDSISLRASLQLGADGRQQLIIERESATAAFEVVKTFDRLSAGWTDLRLLLLPDRNAVALWLNNQPAGTFHVTAISNPQVPSAVSVSADGTTTDVAALEVLVGETN